MADYNELLTSIASVIKTNNRREITGQILQNVLSQMVGSLGENYQLAGFATPSYNPQEPDQNVFYITDTAGQYTNFDNITLEDGLSFLMWKNSQWTAKTIGVATHQWVDNNYVSKAFFRQLFRPKDSLGTEILANDTTSIVDNIQSMVGLWTERYLTALGYGTDGGGAVRSLSQLNDVQLTTPIANNDVLTYNMTLGKWTNTSGGGTGTVRQIKVGSVTYDPVNGLVSLPAYPTIPNNISSFTNDVGYITSSGSCSYATSAGSAGAVAWGNVTSKPFNWSGQSGQPTWLWGSNDGVNYYVWNPSNFSVNYASSAYSSSYATYAQNDYNGNDIRYTYLPLAGGGMNSGARIHMNGGNLYIGNSNNAGWLMVQDICSQNSAGDTYWSIRTSGNAIFANMLSNGYVTALSDERHKDIIDDTHLSVEQIAKMRSVLYRWNDGRSDMSIYAGSIAQDWLCVLPQVVTREDNDEGTLSLQYGVAALIASITIARKVVDHDKQIEELKRQLTKANERIVSLEDEVKQLKAA